MHMDLVLSWRDGLPSLSVIKLVEGVKADRELHDVVITQHLPMTMTYKGGVHVYLTYVGSSSSHVDSTSTQLQSIQTQCPLRLLLP